MDGTERDMMWMERRGTWCGWNGEGHGVDGTERDTVWMERRGS